MTFLAMIFLLTHECGKFYFYIRNLSVEKLKL